MTPSAKHVDGRRERARANRQRVVETAYRMFCERGFEVPMTAIAGELSRFEKKIALNA